MSGRRFLLATVGVVVLAQAAVPPTGTPASPPAPTADMLLDLDLLREIDVARDRDLLERLRLLERMRMLEKWRMLESTAPLGPAEKATK